MMRGVLTQTSVACMVWILDDGSSEWWKCSICPLWLPVVPYLQPFWADHASYSWVPFMELDDLFLDWDWVGLRWVGPVSQCQRLRKEINTGRPSNTQCTRHRSKPNKGKAFT